jgi:hypothetical protein
VSRGPNLTIQAAIIEMPTGPLAGCLVAPALIIMMTASFSFLPLTFSALLIALFTLPPFMFFLYNFVLLLLPKTRSSFIWCHG